MKFIQLLSTIASLAIFATGPGVSAAGLRAAGVDNGEYPSSGRRSLYVKHHGRPGAFPGQPGTMGVPAGGYAGDYYNDNNQAKYYNQMYNNGHGGSYYEGDDEYYAYPAYHGYEAYEYGGPSRGRGGGCGDGENADDFCSQFKNKGQCGLYDHCTCGWDKSLGCHSY